MNKIDPQHLSRGLHPLSWLTFVVHRGPALITGAMAMAFAANRSGSMWTYLIAGAFFVILASYEIVKVRMLRWDLQDQSVVVRSGWLNKDTQVIPFSRIQNVKITQNPLHRLLGVSKVELESAGSKKPEASFDALSLADAHELSRLIQGRAAAPAPGSTEVDAVGGVAAATGEILLHMPIAEVIRYGIVSNRGLLVLAAAAGLMSQYMDDIWGMVAKRMVAQQEFLRHQVESATHLPPLQFGLFAGALVVGIFIFTRVLSILLATWSHYNYTLTDNGRRLSSERGLLSRWHDAIVKSRVQSWRIDEGLLHRLLKRQTLDIDTMMGEETQEIDDEGNLKKARNHLLPIATAQRTAAVLTHLAPQLAWSERTWQRIESRNFWRRAVPAVLIATVAFAAAVASTVIKIGDWLPQFSWAWFAVPWLLIVSWVMLQAWLYFKSIAYSIDHNSFAVRTGIFGKKWHLAEIRKAHVITIHRGPMDRWFGTASLVLDTAGAQRGALQMHYLPVERAESLRDTLLGALNKSVNSCA